MSKAKAEPRALPKRFYRDVAVQKNAAAFCLTLDGKTLKTPAKKLLQVPSQQLAERIAEEWRAQGDTIDADTMPLTRLASITLDRILHDRAALLQEMAAYAQTDLVCYRAAEDPFFSKVSTAQALPSLQQHAFDPLLAWLAAEFSIAFTLTDQVMPIAQPPETLRKMDALFAEATDGELAALAMMIPILGSAVLAFAVWKNRIDIHTALAASRLDETFQAEQWGEDALATEAWVNKCRDATAAAFFLDRQHPQKPL